MADTVTHPVAQDAPMQRRRFSGEDVLAMMRLGVLGEGRVELLDGEIWEMASEGPSHGRLAVWLNQKLIRGLPESISVGCERTVRMSDDHWPEPDFVVFPESKPIDEVRGPDILLLIEISDTTARSDLAIKGPKYREYGVREYWVVDLSARVTHVHKLDGGWPAAPPVSFDDELLPAALGGLTLRLAEYEG